MTEAVSLCQYAAKRCASWIAQYRSNDSVCSWPSHCVIVCPTCNLTKCKSCDIFMFGKSVLSSSASLASFSSCLALGFFGEDAIFVIVYFETTIMVDPLKGVMMRSVPSSFDSTTNRVNFNTFQNFEFFLSSFVKKTSKQKPAAARPPRERQAGRSRQFQEQ